MKNNKLDQDEESKISTSIYNSTNEETDEYEDDFITIMQEAAKDQAEFDDKVRFEDEDEITGGGQSQSSTINFQSPTNDIP